MNGLARILDDRAQLEEALREASPSTLLMVTVQLTGDETLLDTYGHFITGPWDYAECFPAETKAELRRRLMASLEDYASDGRPAPLPASDRLLHRMMSVSVGEEVPEPYVPMLLEEMGFARRDPAPERPEEGHPPFDVAVIGAGMSGLCAAIRLREAGIPFTVYEKNEGVGGTWFENAYPGSGVDLPNHFYSYSFEPNPEWPHYFSKQAELARYFQHCAVKYDLLGSIRFGTEVERAEWDEADRMWRLAFRGPDGATRTAVARAVICAVGQLNRPLIPQIEGLGSFAGPVMHTARWDATQELRGRRVAMIGTGASGMQAAPTIAPEVGKLTIFQRSPQWIAANPNYHRAVSRGKMWAIRHLPFYEKWYRFQLFWGFGDAVHAALQIDPRWPHQESSINAINERFRHNMLSHLERELGDRPDLIGKVKPDYPPYGKRILVDNHWYRMLKRDNVELITDRIDHVTPGEIVTMAGERHAADIIVLATGFQASRMLWPMEVVGRDGRSIRALWGDDNPRAYLGITVPRFPNFFMLYGPNTNLGHGGSIIFHTECQVRYVLQCIGLLARAGKTTMECLETAHDAYNAKLDAALGGMIWSHPKSRNWYRNKHGRVTTNSPWTLLDYWRMTAAPDPADYAIA